MTLEDYILEHIDKEPDYLAKINRNTWLKQINPRMLSEHLQGRILSMLAKMLCPNRVLEIGTFTGYSALCLAEGLNNSGRIDTIEIDDELEDFIRENFKISPFEKQINLIIGDAVEIIPGLEDSYDLVFLDADKSLYSVYFELVLPKVKQGGFIIADNTLWNGKVLEELKHNDKQTEEIIHFNNKITDDKRVEKVILPIRDGLTLIRKK